MLKSLWLGASPVILILAACKASSGGKSGTKDVFNDDHARYRNVVLILNANVDTGVITGTIQDPQNQVAAGQAEVIWDILEHRNFSKCSDLTRRDQVSIQVNGNVKTFELPRQNPDDLNRRIVMSPNMKWDINQTQGPVRVEGCLAIGDGVSALARGIPESGSTGLSLAGGPSSVNINEYGEACAQYLGYIKPWSCFDDGHEVPIYVTSSSGSRTRAMEQVEKCDEPIYLPTGSGYCKPFTRVGRLKTYADPGFTTEKTDVATAFVCRKYNPSSSDQNNPIFNDIAIIQQNKKTGHTCYFQALSDSGGPLYGRRVPPPTETDAMFAQNVPASSEHSGEAQSAKTFWIKPSGIANINCNNCHDNDSFMHDPWVDQLRISPSGQVVNLGDLHYSTNASAYRDALRYETLIPDGAHKDENGGMIVTKYIGTPSDFLGWDEIWAIKPRKFMGYDSGSYVKLEDGETPAAKFGPPFAMNADGSGGAPNPDAASCSGCHTLTTKNTCTTWATDSVGLDMHLSSYRTEFSKKPTSGMVENDSGVAGDINRLAQMHRYWMPRMVEEELIAGDTEATKKLIAKYQTAVREFKRCCTMTDPNTGSKIFPSSNGFSRGNAKLTIAQYKHLSENNCEMIRRTDYEPIQ